MRKRIAAAVIAALFVTMSLIACASVPTPKTVPQKLVYCYGVIEGLSDTVKNLYVAKVIDKQEALDAYDTLAKAWDILEKAEALVKLGQDTVSAAKVNDAIKMLEVLREYLIERSKADGSN